MLNLEQISAFIAAADKGSFSAAARYLGKSQSSISIALNNLEVGLGIRLFDRSSKYPTLTEQGMRTYTQAKNLLRQVKRIQHYAQSALNQVEDTLHIALDPLVPMLLVERALDKMAQAFPYTQVKISKSYGQQLTDAVLNDNAQLGLHLTEKGVPDNLDFLVISQIEWVYVCSPDSKLADMAKIDQDTLMTHRQIACASMLENPVLKDLGKLSQEVWQTSDQDDLIRLVEQGLGWAFLPKTMALERQAGGTLIAFEPEFQHAPMFYAADLIWKANQQQGPAMRYFISLLSERLAR
ncbi:LysR family transcriptional regulator [Motilimonas pumila]|uniref:LysR family transcriptional regulator n=1 Tax=Motilimonas pumila TaxID=2303987 RepID=A0A418YIN1_9GAMM|nr:LysR family transcriptional regulator [Motilimonas pumila]RJG50506.1 LysR family transcriptional regulator [Motilimonas pumila]